MSQTLRCICVGNDPKSDGLLFYSPDFKNLIGSADYTLDPVPPSGTICGIPYDGGVQFDLHCDGDHIHRPPAYQLQDTVHCLSKNLHDIVKNIFIQGNNVIYLIKYMTCGELVERQEHELSDIHSVQHAPAHDVMTPPDLILSPPITTVSQTRESHMPLHEISTTTTPVSWLDDGCKVKVFLPHIMKTPKRGYLQNKNEEWTFQAGRTQRILKSFKIPALHNNINILIADGKIVSGWKTTKHMSDLRELHDIETAMVRRMSFMNSTHQHDLSVTTIQRYIAAHPPQTFIKGKRTHVDVSPLTSPTALSSLKDHDTITPNDKSIWDRAYLHEYIGLTDDTHTWEYITEK